MPLILQRRIYRADLQANPKVLYIFGDNEQRFGFGGQAAEMRGEPNAIGVATLKAPGVFWSEADVTRQCPIIDEDTVAVFSALSAGRVVVFPMDGIGTGLADLKHKSPTTFTYLESAIHRMRVFAP